MTYLNGAVLQYFMGHVALSMEQTAIIYLLAFLCYGCCKQAHIVDHHPALISCCTCAIQQPRFVKLWSRTERVRRVCEEKPSILSAHVSADAVCC